MATALPLTLGTRSGPYETVGATWRAWHGDVDRARDTRLDRDVFEALKSVVPTN